MLPCPAAVRFHLVRGFALTGDVEVALHSPALVEMLSSVSVERVFEELRRCFEKNVWGTLTFFDQHPLLKRKVFEGLGLGLAPVVRSRQPS